MDGLAPDPEGAGGAALGEALLEGAQDQRLTLRRQGSAPRGAGEGAPAATAPAAGVL